MLLVLATIVLLAATTAGGLLRLDVAALCALTVLALAGALRPSQALSGFADNATLTVAAMLALAEGLRRCGITDALGRWLRALGAAGKGRALALILVVTAAASSLVGDVGMVAILIPVLAAQGSPWKPRRVLLPAAVAASLGSLLTLVGSSSNLVADQFLTQATGGHGLGLFTLLPMGAAAVVVGLSVALLAGRVLNRGDESSGLRDLEALQPYLADVRIADASDLDGEPLSELAGLGLRVLRLERGGVRITMLLPDTRLRAGDHLTVQGDIKALLEQAQARGLEVAGRKVDVAELEDDGLRLVEAVVPETSRLAGHSLRRLDFRRGTGLSVLGVRRHGRLSGTRLNEMRLAAGDLLLILGTDEALQRQAQLGVLVMLGGVPVESRRLRRAPLAVGILVVALLLGGLGVLRPQIALGAGAVAMLVTGCLAPDEMYAALDWRVIVSVAALIPVGIAFSQSGLSQALAAALSHWTAAWPPLAVLAICYVFTAVLSQGIHHTAAAAVASPLAVSLAAARHLSPTALVVGVIVAASASPLTPICNKVNLLVMEPGGYRWRDYLSVGLPVALSVAVAALLVIPRVWPLTAGGH